MRYILILLTIFSCSSTKNEKEIRLSYVERELSFFKPAEQTWFDGENPGNFYKNWIRIPVNIQIVHETLKKIGYKKLITEDERFSTIVKCGISIRKPMNELIDSLLLTYEFDTINSTYYREFWNRRANEQNKEIVYDILSDIATELYEDHITEPNLSLVNDTLFNLLLIKEFEDSITQERAVRNFNYLKDIGMHKSAYNLLYERYRYYDIEWNRDKLVNQLNQDTINCCFSVWIEDDTK